MSECESCGVTHPRIVDGVCRECRLEDENGELQQQLQAAEAERDALADELTEAQRNLFISWDIIKHGANTPEQAAYVVDIPTRPQEQEEG